MPASYSQVNDDGITNTKKLYRLMRSAGPSKVASIGGKSVFRSYHDSRLFVSPGALQGPSDLSNMRPLATDADLIAYGIAPAITEFLAEPTFTTAPQHLLGRLFAEQLVLSTAQADQGSRREALLKIGMNFILIERMLADDGPGSCVMADGWIVWPGGSTGLSGVLFAPNIGRSPNPDIGSVLRWDGCSSLPDEKLEPFSLALETMSTRYEIRSFKGRVTPKIKSFYHLTQNAL